MKFKNIPKWILTQLSVLTMVLMPVAQGRAAEKQQQEITRVMVQNAIIEMGLNKSMTYGEFFKKNKDKYPVRLQKELAPYFAKFANQPMPQFDLGSAKSSDGKTYPTLRISQNGQLHNVQFFGETERYAKFNNTTLTEVDLINFDDALIRVMAGDVKLRQQVEKTSTENKTTQKTFAGFPEVTKQSWAKLTPEQRAGYVLSMRLLYNDAHGVLLALNKIKNKKTKKFSFLESILGDEAFAQKTELTDPKTVPTSSEPTSYENTSDSKSSSNNNGLDSCLVAGFVTTYKGDVCTYNSMTKEYKDASVIAKQAIDDCGKKNEIACNPLIFGTPGGVARCISRSNKSQVNVATRYKGPCESENHTNSEIKFLDSDKITKDRYGSNKIKDAAKIRAEALDEQTNKAEFKDATKNFIAGILKYRDNSGEMEKLFLSGKPNDKVMAELVSIKDNFNAEIKEATAACTSASRTKGVPEPNFWGACDQLQRRFIFVAEYLSENPGCLDSAGKKSPVNPATLKCDCAAGSKEASVNPGTQCTIITPKPNDPPVVPPVNPDTVDAGHCYDPVCTSNEICKFQVRDDKGAEVWQCVDKNDKDTKKVDDAAKKKKEKIKKILIGVGAAIVGIGAIVGMYFLFKPKKVKLNPAGDICPNGTNAPCTNTCESPKVYVAGVGCSCAACPPGQTIINANACECGTASTDVKVVCPDNITIVDNLADCPPALYTCWDGSQVKDALNCPEKPTGTSGVETKTDR